MQKEVAGASLKVIGTAALEGKDYNLICEDDQGLVWLDYTNNNWDYLSGFRSRAIRMP